MHSVDIHEVKTHLSRLVNAAASGKPFIITRAGKPVAKVIAADTPDTSTKRRLGFLTGEVSVPKNFDRMGAKRINNLFCAGK